METLTVKGVTIRLEGLPPDILAYLEKKLVRIRRRQAPWFRLVHGFLGLFLPRDYQRAPIESLAKGKVLVIGCAGGIETFGLGATGIDIDREALAIAGRLRRHATDAHASFLAASGGDLPFRSESFDSVLSDNVIEHLPPSIVARHLEESRRVLRPGGHYVFTTPNRLFEQPPKEGHVSLHSHAEWETMALAAGFREVGTPRRRSGDIVSLDWKKQRESAAAQGSDLGISHQGVRIVTLLAVR